MRTTAGPGSTSVRDGGEKPSLNSYLNSEPNFITQPMGTDTSEQLSGCVGLALCLKREKRSLEGQVLASIHRLEIILRGKTAEEWNDQGGNGVHKGRIGILPGFLPPRVHRGRSLSDTLRDSALDVVGGGDLGVGIAVPECTRQRREEHSYLTPKTPRTSSENTRRFSAFF